MRNPLWAVAMALPLMLSGCGPAGEQKAADAPATTVPKAEDVVSKSTQTLAFTPEQKEKIRAPLMQLHAAQKVGKATSGALTASSGWKDVLGQDQPIHYTRCKVATGGPVDDKDCHLYVKPTEAGKAGEPVRWLRFEQNSNGTLWAEIRSKDDARERMECESLEVDENFLSGSCDVKPHTGPASHWFEFIVFESLDGTRRSIYYVYYDSRPIGEGVEVHNGEGHGGTE